VLISVYNEEKHIVTRIENLLKLDYPGDKLEILIGSDGSTDRTDELVRTFPDARVKLRAFEQREGKPSVLNRLVPQAHSELLVFSDATTTDASASRRPWYMHRKPAVVTTPSNTSSPAWAGVGHTQATAVASVATTAKVYRRLNGKSEAVVEALPAKERLIESLGDIRAKLQALIGVMGKGTLNVSDATELLTLSRDVRALASKLNEEILKAANRDDPNPQ